MPLMQDCWFQSTSYLLLERCATHLLQRVQSTVVVASIFPGRRVRVLTYHATILACNSFPAPPFLPLMLLICHWYLDTLCILPSISCKSSERKEKTTPFGVNLMRSQVLYRAVQVQILIHLSRSLDKHIPS